jgi:phosphoenolpyruvate synthase/pyruvate phosphate dikinase
MEFIINEYIKIHPMALLHLDKVEDAAERAEIERLTRGFEPEEENPMIGFRGPSSSADRLHPAGCRCLRPM